MIGWLLIAISLVEVWLGFWFLTKYQKNQATMWYGLFAWAIALYVGANGLGYLINNFYIAERFGWIGGIMTAALILPFSFSFPLPLRPVRELAILAIWPAAVFIPGFWLTDIFITNQGLIDYRGGYQTLVGQYFWFALTFFAIYWLWALVNLFRAMQRSEGRPQWQLRTILIGLVVSLLFSVAFDIILPLVTSSTFGYVGSLFSSIWVGMTAYILVKK